MDESPKTIVEEITVVEDAEPVRLDRYLSLAFRDYSRSFLQRAIREGCVTVNGSVEKPRYLVSPGEHIRVELPVLATTHHEPESMALEMPEKFVLKTGTTGVTISVFCGISDGAGKRISSISTWPRKAQPASDMDSS